MRAIGYVRCSTHEQADSGLGLEAQAERIRAYCTMRNLKLVLVITDAGVSGGKLYRSPVLRQRPERRGRPDHARIRPRRIRSLAATRGLKVRAVTHSTQGPTIETTVASHVGHRGRNRFADSRIRYSRTILPPRRPGIKKSWPVISEESSSMN